MAQIPFTDRELRRAWRELYDASVKEVRGNSHRLLLVYSVECGLKAVWLKQAQRTIFGAPDIEKTGHDLNNIIKLLHLGSKLSPSFDLSDVRDSSNNPVRRNNNRIDALHQAWRYGGKLESSPVGDVGLEMELEAVHLLIKKELSS